MALYMKYSTQIYDIYLRYIAPEDMHVYSIDEVFMDVTHYLNTYHMAAKEIASKMILDVMQETGITATAGTGRDDLPETFVEPQTADRFLAGRTWLPEKVRGGRTLHDGRHCTMFHR